MAEITQGDHRDHRDHPFSATRILRPIKASHTEVVEITWYMPDRSTHVVRVTCPPQIVVDRVRTGVED